MNEHNEQIWRMTRSLRLKLQLHSSATRAVASSYKSYGSLVNITTEYTVVLKNILLFDEKFKIYYSF